MLFMNLASDVGPLVESYGAEQSIADILVLKVIASVLEWTQRHSDVIHNTKTTVKWIK